MLFLTMETNPPPLAQYRFIHEQCLTQTSLSHEQCRAQTALSHEQSRAQTALSHEQPRAQTPLSHGNEVRSGDYISTLLDMPSQQ